MEGRAARTLCDLGHTKSVNVFFYILNFLKKSGLFAFAIIIILPVVMLFFSAAKIENFNYLNHLISHVLFYYVSNSFLLGLGVLIGTMFVGTSLGWIFARYHFWGHRVLQYAIFLPLSVPVYLAAYTTDEFLGDFGILHNFFQHIGLSFINAYWSVNVHSMSMGILILSLCLYPYVYLFAFASFSRQSQTLGEAALLLGKSHWSIFWSLYFPRALPSLFSGGILAVLEALNDVGLTEYLGIPGLSAGIFVAWLGANAFGEAMLLAIVLILICLALLSIDKFFIHPSLKTAPNERRENKLKRIRLKGFMHCGVVFLVILPIFLGFIIPVLVLINLIDLDNDYYFDTSFLVSLKHSVTLGVYTVLIVITASLFLVIWRNRMRNNNMRLLFSFTEIGYALPSVMLGLGTLSLLAYANSLFNHIVFTGGIVGLLYVYSIRLLPVGSRYVRSGFRSINPNFAQAARLLGLSDAKILWRIELPLMRKFIFFACVMIFLDVIKELPATLLLRPFNYETLAAHIYNYASNGNLEASAPAGLLLICLSFFPVLLLRSIVRTDI